MVTRRATTPSGELGVEQAPSEPADVEVEEVVEYIWLGQLFNYFGSQGGFESVDLVRTPSARRLELEFSYQCSLGCNKDLVG